MIIHDDCRHFLGHKPCAFGRTCEGCLEYAPPVRRILIIKLAAVGDVLRTTPLLRGLKRACPDAEITWLTDADAVPLLDGISEIARLLTYGWESALQLHQETFDELYCLDKEPRATALAAGIQSARRAGFRMNRFGKPIPAGANSAYLHALGIDDDLKFRRNTKTYPELIFDCAGLPYPEPQEYLMPDLSREVSAAKILLAGMGMPAGSLKVGLNTGASDQFATKKWTEEGFAGLADLLNRRLAASVLLLGGPAEAERNSRIAARAMCPPFNPGTNHSLRGFAGIIGNLDLLVTGDTLAMHIAIGMKIPVIALFGATCHQEIELYGRGDKVVAHSPCSPCYLSVCPEQETCMESVTAETVYSVTARLLGRH